MVNNGPHSYVGGAIQYSTGNVRSHGPIGVVESSIYRCVANWSLEVGMTPWTHTPCLTLLQWTISTFLNLVCASKHISLIPRF